MKQAVLLVLKSAAQKAKFDSGLNSLNLVIRNNLASDGTHHVRVAFSNETSNRTCADSVIQSCKPSAISSAIKPD